MSTKSNVLTFLEKNKGLSISGEDIGTVLGISRTSVWKAISQLKDEGHSIEATTNKGYILSQSSDLITAQGILAALEEFQISSGQIHVFKTLESTNQTAKELAISGSPHGTVVISETQTKGKGRLGRSFFSPPDTGIYMSVILKPTFDMSQSILVTTAAAVAVCRALKKVCNVDAQIKWVNDIFVSEKKVCGILTEGVSDFESGRIESIILGIGVNCFSEISIFPEEIQSIVGSVSIPGQKFSRNLLAAEIVKEILSLTAEFQSRQFIGEYRDRSLLLGKEIFVYPGGLNSGKDALSALAIDIDNDGGLVIEYPNGVRSTLNTGEVSVRMKG